MTKTTAPRLARFVGELGDAPGTLGTIGGDRRSEPLAITQLMLLYHLLDAVR